MQDPYYLYDEKFVREVFTNEFKSHPLDVHAHVHEDPVNTYELNSLGYRTKEFTQNAELVTAGCSFTFGSGVPEEQRWGALVAKELGVEETNLGVCAWSTHAIVQNLFAYFREYGNPKKLYCLFPDPSRVPLAMVEGFVEYDDGFESGREIVNVMLDRMDDYDYKNKPKYSKRPHDVNDIVPVEMSLYFYMKSVQMLEDYCNTNDIELKWTSWDNGLTSFLESNQHGPINYERFGLTNYLPIGSSEWEWDVSVMGGGMKRDSLEDSKRTYTGCHSEEEAKWGDNFYIGTDIEGLVHWGVHKHLHVAERFVTDGVART